MTQVNIQWVLVLVLLLKIASLQLATPSVEQETLGHAMQDAASIERYMQALYISKRYKPYGIGSIKRNDTKLALRKFVSAETNRRLRGKVRGND
ncbi:hypothetical protein WKS98_07995 [Lagierella sp. ICN-221743]